MVATLVSIILDAQNGNYPMGAKSTGMSHANITTFDEWALFNNPAGIGRISSFSIATTYQSRFNINAFQTMGLAIHTPFEKFNAGIGIYRFGDDVYNQQKLNLAISSQIQLVSLGLGIHWVQNRFSEIGQISTVAFDFGGIAEIIKEFRIGAHLFNFTQSQFTDQYLIPVTMKFGLNYVSENHFQLTGEIEQQLNQPINFRFGLSYHFTNWISFQSGFSTLTQSVSFGIGIHTNSWTFQYGYMNLHPAGTVHEFSLTKSFGKK